MLLYVCEYTLSGIIIANMLDIIPFRVYNICSYQRGHKMEIGQKVKTLRKRSKLTQGEFSLRVGVGLRFVRDLEQGKKTIRLDKLNQVLDFLGCHLEVIKNDQRI